MPCSYEESENTQYTNNQTQVTNKMIIIDDTTEIAAIATASESIRKF